ncbi:hypothetical protein HK405_014490, partial [Cladochytrium tenue]
MLAAIATAAATLLVTALPLLLLAPDAASALSVSTVGTAYQVDTGGGLVFKVNQANGDVISILYNGVQLQDSSKFSQLSSGLGSATVTASTVSSTVVVKCVTSTLTHYYMARDGVNAIFMATYITAEPTVGELRYIARLSKSALPNGVTYSEVNGGTAIEGSDVFMVGTETRSKFYSSIRHIEDNVHGVSGSGVAAFMVIPGLSYETSSGGPFFRDINNQGTAQQELYWYMNSGHMQTEAYRTGLFGPYALAFTTGSTPTLASYDFTFVDALSLSGYVATADRGRLTGKVTGVASNYTITVGWSNSAAQYWATPRSSDNRYVSPYMKPGTYTQTLFRNELSVGTATVSVTAGALATTDVAASVTVDSASPLWRIGDFDGTPAGFLNADKIEHMHPSDARMSAWAPSSAFVVGTSADSAWPMAQFKDVNNGLQIQFSLTAAQAAAGRTLLIGTTLSENSGRPQVTVNTWTGTAPAAPTKIDSRGVTRGTWRGNN